MQNEQSKPNGSNRLFDGNMCNGAVGYYNVQVHDIAVKVLERGKHLRVMKDICTVGRCVARMSVSFNVRLLDQELARS
jgi:hypothetical protein